MNYEEYKSHLAAIDSLGEHAEEIGKRLRPHHWKVSVNDFEAKLVYLTCYWPNYCDKDLCTFPAEWLFRGDWQQLVDARIAEEAREEAAQKAEIAAETEAKERRELERLSSKYESAAVKKE